MNIFFIGLTTTETLNINCQNGYPSNSVAKHDLNGILAELNSLTFDTGHEDQDAKSNEIAENDVPEKH